MAFIEIDPNGKWAQAPRWTRWALIVAALFALGVLILSMALDEPSLL